MSYKSAIFYIAALLILNLTALPMQSMAMPKATAATDAKTMSGKVIETMNAGGYTYMLVASGAAQNWVAIPETQIKVGSQVSYLEGMAMANFASKTLNRTFESIIFSAGLTESSESSHDASPVKTQGKEDSFAAALQAEQKAATAGAPTGQTSGGSLVAIAPLQEISVPKASGDNTYTVAEIFSGNTALAGKKVRVRGKVVKFSPGIMGKNWVHLQDGTGNPLNNSHDLVLTTDASPALETIVTMEGILAADKDFGAGYKYSAIVEQAVLIKEQ